MIQQRPQPDGACREGPASLPVSGFRPTLGSFGYFDILIALAILPATFTEGET